MSEVVAVALVAAVPGAIAAIVAALDVLLSRRNGKKLDVVHDLTNSTLSGVKSDLATALAKVARLEDMLGEAHTEIVALKSVIDKIVPPYST